MDGVFEIVEPGASYTYEFPARPYGMHLYHCHATPLKKHIAKGLYGAFIIDPLMPRPPAQELVMVLTGFDTDGDGENNFYGVNGPAFYYAKYPIRVRRSQTVRIYRPIPDYAALGNLRGVQLFAHHGLHRVAPEPDHRTGFHGGPSLLDRHHTNSRVALRKPPVKRGGGGSNTRVG